MRGGWVGRWLWAVTGSGGTGVRSLVAAIGVGGRGRRSLGARSRGGREGDRGGGRAGVGGAPWGGVGGIRVRAVMAKAVSVASAGGSAKASGAEAKSATPVVPVNEDVVFVVQVVDAVKIEEVKVGQGDEVAGARCVAITAHTITG